MEAGEGARAIPTWGKVWLAIAGVYPWEGVHAVPPELFAMPTWVPGHPGGWYCHTRLIALGMSLLSAARFSASPSTRVEALRAELHPLGYEASAGPSARGSIHAADVVTPPSALLRALYRISDAFDERRVGTPAREETRAELHDAIRYELDATGGVCISPVSGLLFTLALYDNDPEDPDVERAWDGVATWFWEDDVRGARIAGARSATWDTAFAIQALNDVDEPEAIEARDRAQAYLDAQQMRRARPGFERFHRIDPRGGYCFADGVHGWPVSDCTAEAMLARLENPAPLREDERADLHAAALFVLRCQNEDGGFGSYEPRGSRLPLDLVDPSEMFRDSMTERSYVECTSSCVAALAAYVERVGGDSNCAGTGVASAIQRGVACLLASQRPDGAWPAAWGVYFTYGTLFGIRGLRAGGVPSTHPAIRRAETFLLGLQREDGSFGEAPETALNDRVAPAREGHVVQTAWALMGLIEAGCAERPALEAAARFLMSRQHADGSWPEQPMSGLFFRSALLRYHLYRAYFPLQALARYRRFAEGRSLLRPESPAGEGAPLLTETA